MPPHSSEALTCMHAPFMSEFEFDSPLQGNPLVDAALVAPMVMASNGAIKAAAGPMHPGQSSAAVGSGALSVNVDAPGVTLDV